MNQHDTFQTLRDKIEKMGIKEVKFVKLLQDAAVNGLRQEKALQYGLFFLFFFTTVRPYFAVVKSENAVNALKSLNFC